MKKLLTLLLLCSSLFVIGQNVPDAINYQSVLRNSNGSAVPNQNVSIRFSILQGSVLGTFVFQEEHSITTSDIGLINLKIGEGLSTLNSLSSINWSLGPYFLEIEVDTTSTGNYISYGTSELSSVPYSLYSMSSAVTDSLSPIALSSLPQFSLTEAQVDSMVANNGYLTTEVDSSITNEIQDLQLAFNNLTITNNANATNINLTGYLDNTVLTETEVDAFVSNNGYLTTEVDSSITNEIQDLQDVLSESNDASNKAVFNVKRQSIGQLALDTSAVLDVASVTQGFLPPRMTAAQRDLIYSPAAGLMIWCLDCGSNGQLQVFNGSQYTDIIGGQRAIFKVQLGADIDGEAAEDISGNSVSLSSDGTIMAIAASYNDGNGSNAGHVRIYEDSSGTWVQLGSDIDGEAANDRSGHSVSLSSDGTIVAIGAPRNDGNGSNAGHVRVYEDSSGTWVQLGADIDGEAASDYSGYSVSLSSDGSTVAIGARYNDGNGSYSGHVRIYENVSGTWTQIGADIDGEASYNSSGYSVSLSSDGTIVAIGAYLNDGNGNNAGHVRIYENVSGTWTQLGADIDGEAADDYSGFSVSLSSDGSTVAIGATVNDGNGSDAGHVRVYEDSSGTWVQLGADIDGEAASDYSGYSVSLSSDGSTVAIGARYNDGNGSNSGHVRIYENVSGTWTQLGADIDGEAASDYSGYSVSLSSDGSTVAIGAVYNDGNGSDAGHVRIYEVR
jgi:Flp pilus assembly pilin Flp